MVRALVDGVVFENGGQMGIWRSFYEVMTRLSNQVDYTLLLRSKPVQALPGGVRLVCDSARARAARWNLIGRARKGLGWIPKPRRLPAADVYHSTYFTPCPKAGVPVVVTVHDMIAERFALWQHGWPAEQIQIKRTAILSAALCIAVSKASADDLKLFYPQVAERIRVVHHGSEHLGRLESTGECQSEPSAGDSFALFVGARQNYKNFVTLLDAVRSPLWPPGLYLHVVGGPFYDYEAKFIEISGLTDRVRMLGPLSDEDLKSQYKAARCLVFPSRMEGFGIPILEAQANACPVVASDIPVFREVAGEGALFFDPRLGEKLAEAVAAACEPGTRCRLIQAGSANIRRFSWDCAAEQIRAVYEEAAGMPARDG